MRAFWSGWVACWLLGMAWRCVPYHHKDRLIALQLAAIKALSPEMYLFVNSHGQFAYFEEARLRDDIVNAAMNHYGLDGKVDLDALRDTRPLDCPVYYVDLLHACEAMEARRGGDHQ